MDYHQVPSRPENDGWIRFLRDRLQFSFTTIERRKKGATRYYVLDGPILNASEGACRFGQAHNLWMRALAFYAAGKIADAHPLGQLMHDLRKAQKNQISCGPFGYSATLGGQWISIWDSVQLERLWILLNINRLDCERASTAHIMQALEFIIKAISAHCNHRCEDEFYFQDGHDLGKLYKNLPCDCKSEFERESTTFVREFMAERKASLQAITSFPPLGHSQGDSKMREDAMIRFQKMVDVVAGKKYLDMVNNEGIPEDSNEIDDWIPRTLRGAGNWIDHRYGPTPRHTDEPISGIDPYSVDKIYSAQLAARFFLEHLFGVRAVIQTEGNPISRVS